MEALLRTAAVAASGFLIVTLQGCGGSSEDTTITTTTTTTTTTLTTSWPVNYCPANYNELDSVWCTTKECCKALVFFPEDGQYCNDFFDKGANIALSMITVDVWNGGSKGAAGMDRAGFNEAPPKAVNSTIQQAMSISNSMKGMFPYQGASSHGVGLGIGPNSTFWKYFETCPHGELSAQCSDGLKCPPGARETLGAMSYEQFGQQVKKIVEQTGTPECNIVREPTAYNEFDTNGLSSHDLAGVFVAKGVCGAARCAAPSYADVCRFMSHANLDRQKPWPVYGYNATGHPAASSLSLDCYLDCNGILDEALLDIGVDIALI